MDKVTFVTPVTPADKVIAIIANLPITYNVTTKTYTVKRDDMDALFNAYDAWFKSDDGKVFSNDPA